MAYLNYYMYVVLFDLPFKLVSSKFNIFINDKKKHPVVQSIMAKLYLIS